MKLDESQINAIEQAKKNKLTVITGNAGHGKTTILKEVVKTLKEQREKVELCSFTGRAAARIFEATGYEASTIHSMLMYQGDGFKRKTLEGITVVCDEASMLSSELLAEILSRKPKRVILAGDSAQLLPIDVGQPFMDIINLYPQNKCELTKAYRNQAAIYQASKMIRNGQIPPNEIISDNEKYTFTHTGDPIRTHNFLLNLVKNKKIDFFKTQILVPRNGAMDENQNYPPATINGLNIAIKNIINPSDKRLSEGDKVICIKNDSELGIYNGTLGTVKKIDYNKTLYFECDNGEIIEIPESKVKHIKLAYAISVHKYQGSQADNTIFLALNRDSFSLLNRNMIYTAVTRAKHNCMVIGETQAIQRGLSIIPTKETVLQQLHKG